MIRFRPPGRPGPMLAVLIAAVVPAAADAAVLRVPQDHPTLRAAVAAAARADTILIAPGSHAGGAFVDHKSLIIASRFLVTGDTTLVAATVLRGASGDVCGGAPDCAGNAVLEFGRGAGGSAVIGLTLTGGEDGVRSAARVDILHCRVVGNDDGVDFTPGSGGTFRACVFAENRDDGIDLNGRVSVRVEDCVIRDNREDGVEFRLYAYRGPALEIAFLDNRITGNGGDGIQLIDYPAVSDYRILVEGNLFHANGHAAVGCMPDGRTVEDFSGAAMAERLSVFHNTFMGERYGLVGGAQVVALNNIFTAIRESALRRVGGRSITAYNLFWGNRTDHEQSNVDPTHLLRADPRLDAAGRPAAGSPALDAGAAWFVWQGDTLLHRPPAAYAGRAPDLGAFERGGPGRAGSSNATR